MTDVDPSAFLRSAKTQGSEAPLHDAKKRLRVPDGFIDSEVKKQTGDTVTIELNTGQSSLDQQVKDLSDKLKAAKRDNAKYQARILELEGQLDDEAKARATAQKALKKSDNKSKDFSKQLEEEKSNAQRLQEQINQLSGKMRTLRREKEAAKEESDSNLKKWKRAKAAIEDCEDIISTLQGQLRAAAKEPKVTV